MWLAKFFCKAAVLSVCLFVTFSVYSQTPSIEKLDVYTRTLYPHGSPSYSLRADSVMARLNNIPDTAYAYATLVVTLTNPIETDSVSLSITNSEDVQVYNAQIPLSGMQGESGFGAIGKTFRIKVGPYTHLKRFTATAAAVGNGNTSPIITFTKN